MKIFNDLNNVGFVNPVVTLGVFDGVHTGHRQIINLLTKKAKEVRGEAVLVTFWPHPRIVVRPDIRVELLTTLDEKITLLEKTGIENLVVIHFDLNFAAISYRQFIREYLVNKIGVHSVIAGYDHHFGHNREGNFEKLSEFSLQYGFEVEKLDAQLIENKRVSSSVIRQSLQNGNISLANKYLGYDYFFSGYVIEGDKRGRSLGYPTANIYLEEKYKMVPGVGVYAVMAEVDKVKYKGMMNIGFKPTFIENNKQKAIEVHLLDFDQNIYGKHIRVKVIEKVRDEKKHSSVDSLKEQLQKDEEGIRQILSRF